MNDPAAPILRGIPFPHDGDHELLTPDPTEPDGSCAHDWLCAYCNTGLNGSNVKQLIRDREDALGGERRLQELLDRAYDERDTEKAMRIERDEARTRGADLTALVAEVERLRQEPHWKTVAEERAATIDTLEAEAERLRGALEHYALMDWLPDSDERGEIAREALGVADPHDEVG